MATAIELIKQSLRYLTVIAAGETPTAEEANDALTALNQMLDRWSNEKMMVYHITNSLYDVVPGVGVYTLGPTGSGAAWDCGARRPVMMQKWAAFVRQYITPNLSNDYKLDYIPNDRYQNIFLKQMTSNFPSTFAVEYGWPIMTIKLWPIPSLALKFSLSTFDQFTRFNLTDSFEFPPGYESAMAYNLAVDISPEYGKDPSPVVLKRASETKAALQQTNSDMIIMETDSALVNHGTFNIFAG